MRGEQGLTPTPTPTLTLNPHPKPSPSPGNYQKLRGARAHLATLHPRTLVLFADAYDVLYAADGAALRRRYEELHVSPEKVLAM